MGLSPVEALSGALADVTMLCLRDQSAADGGPVVAMLDTAPQGGRLKLTTIEKCEIALYRRKTDCWPTVLVGWLTALRMASIRQNSIMV